jgi:hypothetical protein
VCLCINNIKQHCFSHVLQQQNQKKGSLSLALQFVEAEEPDEQQLQQQQQEQQQHQEAEQNAQLDAVAPRQLEPGQVSPRRARSPRVCINSLIAHIFAHMFVEYYVVIRSIRSTCRLYRA